MERKGFYMRNKVKCPVWVFEQWLCVCSQVVHQLYNLPCSYKCVVTAWGAKQAKDVSVEPSS